MRKRWLIVMVLVAALLSACGVNMSGEPKIVDEVQIWPTNTPAVSPTPSASAAETPAEATAPSGTAAPASDAPAANATQAPDRTLGRELFLANCVQCHGGEDGVGPSLFTTIADAGNRVEGLDKAAYIYQSIVDPGAYVLEGYQNVMPSYAGQFSEFELASIVAFIAEAEGRPTAESLNSVTPTAAAAAAPITGQDNVLTVRGRVVQGTTNGETIPAGLAIDLLVLNSAGSLVGQYSAVTSEGGAYEVNQVARAAGNIYLIRVNYAGVPQGVQISAIEGTEKTLTQDVTVYERTTDRASIQVRWAQMLINFAPINEFGVEVWLSLELVNTGDRIVTTDEVANTGWLVSVPVDLPPGAFGIQPMQTEGSNRFQVDLVDGVPVVKDTWPLRPGQVHSITIAYYLPYEDQAVIDTAINFPVIDGAILIPNDTVSFSSDQFDAEGEFRYRVAAGGFHISELGADEVINPERDFTLVKAHDLIRAVSADERLVFTLTGRPTRTIDVIAASPEPAKADPGQTDLLPIALFVLGLSILALAGVLWWRQRAMVQQGVGAAVAAADGWTPPRTSDGKEALLAALVELDDARAAGTLDDDTYQQRRAMVADQLLPLLGDDDES